MARSSLIVLCLASFALLQCIVSVHGTRFGYIDGITDVPGPSYWGSLPYSQRCSNGMFQSPIDLQLPVPRANSNGPLTAHYLPLGYFSVLNTGHTLVIHTVSDEMERSIILAPGLFSAPLGYRLHQIQLRWGRNSTEGSEHTFDSVRFPLEVQLVHYNSKFASVEAAMRSSEPDAVIILSAMYKVGTTTPNSLKTILRETEFFDDPSEEREFDTQVNFLDMIPDRKEYYTYLGSFTTPRCNEVVRWVIFARFMTITEADLMTLRRVRLQVSVNGAAPSYNFRPVQDLGVRKLTSSFSTLRITNQ